MFERFQLSQLTVVLVIDKEQDLNCKCLAWETDPVWWRTKILYCRNGFSVQLKFKPTWTMSLNQAGQFGTGE